MIKKKVREYLFVGIDDFSRELYVNIAVGKIQFSATQSLSQFIDECPYVIECFYTDNGKEYKGTQDHELIKYCLESGIKKKYMKIKRPQTSDKAERIIRTLMDMLHKKRRIYFQKTKKNILKKVCKLVQLCKLS